MSEPDPPLVVDPAKVARLAGLDPSQQGVLDTVREAIQDVIADVEAYLGRPIIPAEYTEKHVRAIYDEHSRTYDVEHPPIVQILEETAELDEDEIATGLYTVRYIGGIDARERPYVAIRRYIEKAAAFAHPLVRRLVVQAKVPRQIKSVSADGQSVTYVDEPKTNDSTTAEGVPPMSTMDKWRIAGRTVYIRPGWTRPPEY